MSGKGSRRRPGNNEAYRTIWERVFGKHEKGGSMLARYESQNCLDADGNPAGGSVRGTGLVIDWQDGPLGRGDERKEPNGAFVETVIDAARQRIEFYQNSKFKCWENAVAITNLEEALMLLNKRTQDRERRQVEGEHKV